MGLAMELTVRLSMGVVVELLVGLSISILEGEFIIFPYFMNFQEAASVDSIIGL